MGYGIKPLNAVQILPRLIQVIKKKITDIHCIISKLSYPHLQIEMNCVSLSLDSLQKTTAFISINW